MSEDKVKIEEAGLLNMRKARSELLLAHPFFASYALRLTLKADFQCRDLWTDGEVLAFNPYYASLLSRDAMVTAQAHEVMHLACAHHIRRKGRDEKLWNKACDYAINSILQDAGFKLPENFRQDPKYKDMSVDDIYTDLLRLNDDDVHGGGKNANVAEKADSTEGGSLGSLESDSDEMDISDENKKSQAKDEENTGEENKSQVNNVIKESDIENTSDQDKKKQSVEAAFHGEVKDHPLMSDENNENAKEIAEQEANINLAQAIQSAAFAGETPLGLLRLFKETIAPSLDWRTLLQRFIENCNDGDYSWSTPNRRYIYQDIYLPSRNETRIPYIALAIDSSGSVDEKTLALFCTELDNILESYDTNLLVLYHDTRVQKHAIYGREDRPLNLSVQGGGGTDFRSIPKFIEEENFHPKALLWFTDMECELFPDEPHYPVLWVSSKKQNFEPPFGETIYLV